MPTILNPPKHVPNAALVALLNAYMRDKTSATFNDIRTELPLFIDLKDGEIQQVVQDAEFNVEYP